MKKIAIILFVSISTVGIAQISLPRFAEPVRLDMKINTEAEESMPLLSSDKGTLFFVRSFYRDNTGGKMAGQDIWTSTGKASNWTEAVNSINGLNNDNNNAIVGISRDGKRYYLLNQYIGKNKAGAGLSVFEPGKDEAPRQITIPGLELLSDYYGFYMHPDEKILLISAKLKSSAGEEDLYVSLWDEKNNWSEPIHLGSTINTTNYEISPFLSDDTKTLYFSTAGRGGYGLADIFFSVRQDDSWKKWSPPQNMGNKINSRGFDAYFSIYENDIYYASNKSSEMCDIYYTRVMTRAELESMLPPTENIYFLLNSYMIDGTNKEILDGVVKTLEANQELKVVISGFTCSLGNELRNQRLSEMRAGSVMDYLLAYGITVERIEISGYGESNADKADQNEETQKKFRKVEIKFDYLN